MKNIISKGCLFVVLITMLASCTSIKPAVMQNETITTKTITETVHDTIFKIEKDSASYQALLDCQNGKVLVKEVINAEPGRTLKSPKVRIDNNKLQVDCEARAQELFAQWKSTHETEKIFISKEVPVVTNILTWWQQTQIKLFKVLVLVLIGWIVFSILKKSIIGWKN